MDKEIDPEAYSHGWINHRQFNATSISKSQSENTWSGSEK